MKALALNYESRRLEMVQIAEPPPPGPGEVLFRVLETGVCGTDRELARFHFGTPPAGESRLILGHEALGEVVAVGSGVTGWNRGNLLVPTIRRSCSTSCVACIQGRRDLCQTGAYHERGIFHRHGYFAEFAVDSAEDLIPVPAALSGSSVLLEPLSVVEKAVEAALKPRVLEPRNAVVYGAGPVGLLTAMVLIDEGLEVTVRSREPAESPRADLVRAAGARYTGSAETGFADIAIEAAGSPLAATEALAALRPGGVLVLLGAPRFAESLDTLDLIVRNITLQGIVNAAPHHFHRGLARLKRMPDRVLLGLVRRRKLEEWPDTILASPPEAKSVHVIATL